MHIKDRVANSPVKSSKDTVSDTGRIKERAFQVDLIVERCSVTIGEIRNRPVGVKVFERQVWLLKHAPHGNADIIIQSRPPLFTPRLKFYLISSVHSFFGQLFSIYLDSNSNENQSNS